MSAGRNEDVYTKAEPPRRQQGAPRPVGADERECPRRSVALLPRAPGRGARVRARGEAGRADLRDLALPQVRQRRQARRPSGAPVPRPAPLVRNPGDPRVQHRRGSAHDGPPSHHHDGALPTRPTRTLRRSAPGCGRPTTQRRTSCASTPPPHDRLGSPFWRSRGRQVPSSQLISRQLAGFVGRRRQQRGLRRPG